MKTISLFTLATIFSFVLISITAATATADIISNGQGTGSATGTYRVLYQTLDAKGNAVSKEKTIWSTGINAAITDDAGNIDQTFAACVDVLTSYVPGTEYNAYDLWSDDISFMSDNQKTDIVSLVSHVYESLFTEKTDWRGLVVMDKVGIRALQFSIWEILQENPEGSYDLNDGWFQALYGSDDASQGYLDEASVLAASWLAAVSDTTGTLWNEMGYTAVDYDYTIWVAANGKSVSQSLITVTPATTPEPASMLIFGVGMLGLGFAAKRRKRESVV